MSKLSTVCDLSISLRKHYRLIGEHQSSNTMDKLYRQLAMLESDVRNAVSVVGQDNEDYLTNVIVELNAMHNYCEFLTKQRLNDIKRQRAEIRECSK